MKYRNSNGESLMESLVSILILTFSSVLLLTVMTAAVRINHDAGEMDRAVFRQLLETELAPAGQGTAGRVTVTVNGEKERVPVEVFSGGGFTAWYREGSP